MLQPDENQLIGKWIYQHGQMEEDVISKRIRYLITNHLLKITTDSSGWDLLYLDPTDNRYWELCYMEGHWQGGGPPSLFCLSYEAASKKYNIK